MSGLPLDDDAQRAQRAYDAAADTYDAPANAFWAPAVYGAAVEPR